MLEHTRKHPIKEASLFCMSEQGNILKLPGSIIKHLDKYEVHDARVIERILNHIKISLNSQPEEVFAEINSKYGKTGALIKAIRLRDGMSQSQFAATIQITQGDLSKIERGKRSVGKEIAQRIGKRFGINPNLLLQISH